MKKVVAVLTLLIYIVLSPLSAFANVQVEDALMIDDATRNALSVSEDNTVIRVYFGYFMYGFSLGKTLEEILNDGWSLHQTSYVFNNDSGNGETEIVSKTIKDGVATDSKSFCDFTLDFYEMIDDDERILSVLGPFVTAQKKVYMHGQYQDGMYIYYETNIGDYVYYKDWPGAEEEYLVPLNEFYNIAKTIQDERSVTTGSHGLNSGLNELSSFDLSNYTARKANIVLTILCFLGPILVIASFIVWFLRRKRKKHGVEPLFC